MNSLIARYANRNTSHPIAIFPLLFLFSVIMLSLFIGLAIGLEQNKLLVVLFGGLGGVMLLFLTTQTLLISTLVITIFIVGQLTYFAGIKQALWIPYGLGLLFFLKLPDTYLKNNKLVYTGSTTISLWVTVFIAMVFISALLNMTPLMQIVVGSKNIIFLWSLYFLIAWGGISSEMIDTLWKKFSWLVLFQVPILLYQYLVIAPSRSAQGGKFGVSWDAVVGGFGGDPMSGGASGTLAFFLVVGLLYFTSLLKHGLIPIHKYAFFCITILFCLLLAEVKVVVLLVPVGLGVIFAGSILRHTFKFFFSSVFIVAILLSILVVYEYQKNEVRGHVQNPFDLNVVLDKSFGYSFDSNVINFETREMGRLAAITHWWEENGFEEPLHSVFGYGPGASRIQSTFAVGEVAKKYPFNINRSALTQLLWEVGLVGVVVFIIILLKASILSYKVSSTKNISPHRQANLETNAAALMMLIVMLPYGRDVLEVPSLTVFMMFMLGMAEHLNKEIKQ